LLAVPFGDAFGFHVADLREAATDVECRPTAVVEHGQCRYPGHPPWRNAFAEGRPLRAVPFGDAVGAHDAGLGEAAAGVERRAAADINDLQDLHAGVESRADGRPRPPIPFGNIVRLDVADH